MVYKRDYAVGNYSVCQINVMDSLETKEARAAFLWACDRPEHDRCYYKAEAFAREVDMLKPTIRALITASNMVYAMSDIGGIGDPSVIDDLDAFIMKRHANWIMPSKGRTYLD